MLPTKLFVGNLPYETDESKLLEWFTENGFPADSANIIIDRLSGESRGFAFVEMDDRVAKRCVVACNGKEFLGRTLILNEARLAPQPTSRKREE